MTLEHSSAVKFTVTYDGKLYAACNSGEITSPFLSCLSRRHGWF